MKKHKCDWKVVLTVGDTEKRTCSVCGREAWYHASPASPSHWITCPHRSEPVNSVSGTTAGCGCGSTRVDVYDCRHFGEPVIKQGAARCLEKMQAAIPLYTGRTCRECHVPRTRVTAAGPGPLAERLTVCLTYWLREASLAKCLESLDASYPGLPRVVVDTGGNLSRGRNEAIRQASTPLVAIAEEDFVYQPGEYLERLVEVLDHDPEIGGACGFVEHANRQDVAYWYWYANLRRFRGGLYYERPTEWRATPQGTWYAVCDLLPNAGVWRREVFDLCPWDESLEIQEHQEWFWRLKQGERWGCAYVPSVSLRHEPDRTNPTYRRMRIRSEFRVQAEAKIGAKLREFRGSPPDGDRPNVVVLGLGHANTTLTTRQLEACGWHLGDADERYAESVSVRAINERYQQGRGFDGKAAAAALQALPQPWAIKDPRFSRGALRPWLGLLARYRPLLLWVEKDHAAIAESHRRRGEESMVPHLAEWQVECERQFRQWPFAKIRVRAEAIIDAARIVRPRTDYDTSGWDHQ